MPFTGLSALANSPLTGLPAVFDSLYVASPYTIYPFSSGGQSLFDLQMGTNGGLILNVPIISGLSSTTQAAMALSNDLGVPGRNFPQYLFSISNESDPSGIISLFRVDPASYYSLPRYRYFIAHREQWRTMLPHLLTTSRTLSCNMEIIRRYYPEGSPCP